MRQAGIVTPLGTSLAACVLDEGATMTYQADDFSGFGSLADASSAGPVIDVTVSVLRTSLGLMGSEGRSPTNQESRDVLGAIASFGVGDALAARIFARRALSFSERRAAPRPHELLVDNAAFKIVRESLEEVADEEWERTFAASVGEVFHLCKAAPPHMKQGAAVVITSSINSDKASPHLLACSATKAAVANFTAGLGQAVAQRGIRVNCVAPGLVWTPLIPSRMPPEEVAKFGTSVPIQRPAQPAEMAPCGGLPCVQRRKLRHRCVLAVTGGTPLL
jgi:NAD(P)-dependent dehydrogenase (short-subunit alcohol dehydrogenase family)